MLIINKIQKEIYNQLTESKSEHIKKLQGIFTSPPVNANFPYLILDIKSINTEINCDNYNTYLLNSTIKIFDRNENNGNIAFIMNDTITELLDLIGMNIENLIIVDFMNIKTNFEVFNDITSIWSCILEFTIIVKQVNK